MDWNAGYCVWYNQRVQSIDSYVSPANQNETYKLNTRKSQ